MNIFLIDDNPDMLLSLSSYLKIHNINAYTFLNPRDAIKELKIFRPDLIIVDYFMSGIKGDDFAIIANRICKAPICLLTNLRFLEIDDNSPIDIIIQKDNTGQLINWINSYRNDNN